LPAPFARTLAVRNSRRIAVGILASLAAVAAVTALVYLLEQFVPVFSLGALYVLAVLPIAVFWGRAYSIGVAVASVLTFNYFFLPPVLTFTLSGEENWLTLAIYVVTGLLVADLAARARRRAREAEQREREAALLAELSTVLLSGAEVTSELARIAEGTARLLGVASARIELGTPSAPGPGDAALELGAGERFVGTLYVTGGVDPSPLTRQRFLPALASLLAVAIERERLAREALEAESLRRSDAMKTALLRTVSHDLRSPLTAIRVGVESLANPALDLDQDDRDSLLETVRVEAYRLDRLVGNLLDLSRLQAGSVRPRRELRALDALLAQALGQLRAEERIDVSLPAEPLLVHADADQVERVLVNLLENALKFSPPESRVAVRVASAGGEALVTVEDEGPGLSPAELERIFLPFQHGSTVADGTGTGLGLAIARGFAEANGGRVAVESRRGHGASFTLALPLALAPPVEASA
jgi:two-component system, OmpR family, sensor histidine kinase KdpD